MESRACIQSLLLTRTLFSRSHALPVFSRIAIFDNIHGQKTSSPLASLSPSGPSASSRRLHTRRNVSSAAAPVKQEIDAPESEKKPSSSPALAYLPLSTLLRSYLITFVSSHPSLLKPSLAVLTFLTRTKSPLLSPDTNPLLHYLLKKTFYIQFCAGETPQEVHRTISDLKAIGYRGVILGHAKEVVLTKEDAEGLDASKDCPEQARCNEIDTKSWEENTCETIKLTQKGDFVALKFTGAGRQALQHLNAGIACAPAFEEAVHKICRLAQERKVGLLFDAEQAALQDGIDKWTMYFARRYNTAEKALVYGTYQAYAKRTPETLARHLHEAQKGDFMLGVKLVRGAYLGSDPRHLFWPTIEDTHKCYDGIAEALIKGEYNNILRPVQEGDQQVPKVDFVLASHNAESVNRAHQIRNEQASAGRPLIRMAYGQLMGMADHVSCQLVKAAKEQTTTNCVTADCPRPYKYLVWGKLGECMKYLLRRAQENQDAVTRTVAARQALGQELVRRTMFWR